MSVDEDNVVAMIHVLLLYVLCADQDNVVAIDSLSTFLLLLY